MRARQDLLADRTRTGRAWCLAHADVVDGWVASVLGDERDVCVVAVGSLGRRELCPHSDVDLVLLHRGARRVAAVADRLWYPIWDAGVSLDHSVRTVKEALSVADADLKAAIGLLDARAVAGDATLAAELIGQARTLWRRRGRRWLGDLDEAIGERHARLGEVAFLLEPDLKDGRGGLRDAQMLTPIALASPVPVDAGPVLARALDTLLGARVELHRRTARASERLLLQEQDGVAAALRYPNADALMSAVAGAARTISFVCDGAWRRARSWLAGPRGRTAARDRDLDAGVVLRDGEVVLSADAAVRGDPSVVFRVAAAAAHADAPIAPSTLDRLAAEAPPPGNPWPDGVRRALLSLLGAGRSLIPSIEAIDQRGLLVRMLPEWSPVRNRPQRNAYHRFTVDRHLCETAVEAAALARQVARPDLLLVGAWLHDLGKGSRGDHTDAGVVLMRQLAPRMGFGADDSAVLVALVRHHLLLADVATRRDLSDPATVARVADAVGDDTTLALLGALTEADSRATGPAAWSPWKAALVRDLMERVSAAMAGGGMPPPARPPGGADAFARARAGLRRGPVYVERAAGSLLVAAADRRGLFADVAGTLALHGMNVLAADVWTDDGVAVELFRVEDVFGETPDAAALEADLARAATARLAVDARLAERARTYARRAVAASHRAAPRVLVDEDASDRATVVEVRTPDGVAVLYRITKALAALGLDVRHAKVSTLGAEVVDSFYVVDATGAKLAPGRRDELQRSVLTALAPG